MKHVPEALDAHLRSGATTLCWCWRMTRKDGLVQGFTDHDRDLVFDGVTFEASAGFTASEIKDSVGLSVDNLEVTSALSSERLSEPDLAAGLYDDARVEIFRVNWQDTEQRLLIRSGSLGEVRRAGPRFTAEVRGLAHYLQQPRGRLFQYTCDADLGDTRCGLDAGDSALSNVGSVTTVIDARRFTAAGLSEYASNWFSRGLLTFTSGAAEGQSVEVKRHTSSGGEASIELWHGARMPLLTGQTFTISAGCDKHVATCRDKFFNVANYRGFPHMPGNDFLTATVAKASE